MSEALKPCPFCGGEAEITRVGDRRQSTQYSCTHCGCFLETGEEWGHGAAWNTRSDLCVTREEADAAVALALEGAAKFADPPLMHRKGAAGLWRTRRAAIAAAIRALIPTSGTDALARMRREAHNAAIDAAAKVCKANADKAKRQGRGGFIAHQIDAEAIAALALPVDGGPQG